MNELLTLSIAETRQNEYKVIVYDLNDQQYKALSIQQHEFYNADGTKAWDLFGITRAELSKGKGEFYIPQGETLLSEYFSKEEMKKFFEQKKEDPKTFFQRKKPYGIIKIDIVHRLSLPIRENNRIKQYIDFTTGGERLNNKLIKDFRWVSYWQQIPEHLWGEKIKHWQNYFNHHDRQIYTVIYRHTFRDGTVRDWIAGFHCL
jgi:hypothetical protein